MSVWRQIGLAALLLLPVGAAAAYYWPQGPAAWSAVARADEPRAADPASATAPVTAPTAGADPRDPAAWGEDHVGQELPIFIEGGECLFCHRHEVGPNWVRNQHALSIRDLDATHSALAALQADQRTKPLLQETVQLVGGRDHARVAHRGERYGHLDMLTTPLHRGRSGNWRLAAGEARWDTDTYNQRCAGCHSSHVELPSQAFSAVTLDCSVCHGDATEDHANDPSLMLLSAARKDPPEVITSACAQCHLRGSRSRASGLPYANHFIAGDNLFRDLEVDWTQAENPELNPGDRHIYDNVRAVVLEGRTELTCLSCHTIHARGNEYPENVPRQGPTEKHRHLADVTYCRHCHAAGRPLTEHLKYEVHSSTCDY